MEEVAPDRVGDTPDTLLAHHLASAPVPQGASPLVERVRWLQARVGWDDRHERLAEHPLLSGLRRSEIRRWAVAADEVEFDPGEMLLHEGRIGYWFFLVHTGSAVQTRRGRHVGEVMAGGHVGEIAILGCGPQPATVKANTPVQMAEAHGMKLAMTALYNDRAAVPSARLIMLVHDELIAACDYDDRYLVAAWFRRHPEERKRILDLPAAMALCRASP